MRQLAERVLGRTRPATAVRERTGQEREQQLTELGRRVLGQGGIVAGLGQAGLVGAIAGARPGAVIPVQGAPRDALSYVQAQSAVVLDTPPVRPPTAPEMGEPDRPPPPDTPAGASTAVASAFARWWACYPRKVGKTAARRAFIRLRLWDRVDELVQAVQRQSRSDQWVRGYIPNPVTWLNQGRWEDEVPATQALGQCMWNIHGTRADGASTRCSHDAIEERDGLRYCRAHVSAFGERTR